MPGKHRKVGRLGAVGGRPIAAARCQSARSITAQTLRIAVPLVKAWPDLTFSALPRTTLHCQPRSSSATVYWTPRYSIFSPGGTNRKPCIAASIRRRQFAGKPTGCLGFEGIRCNDVYLDLIALGAFEQSVFETNRPWRNALQHHPRLATRTAGALNGGQELLDRGHDASLHWAGALPNSLSPIICRGPGGDSVSMHRQVKQAMVNTAHI